MAEKSSIRLYPGDCLEVMAGLDVKVDAIICDPPYGATACAWDQVVPLDKMWQALKRLRQDDTAVLLFGNEPFSSRLRLSNINEFKYDIYWQKERATNIFQLKHRPGKVIETISVFYKSRPTYNPQMAVHRGAKRSNKVKHGKLGALIDSGNKKPHEYKDSGLRYPLQIVDFKRDILTSNLHPTQKPVRLMEYLIKTYTNPGGTVLDFAMGSGTTGVACQNTGRNFIGIELDEGYFRIAEKRLEHNPPK